MARRYDDDLLAAQVEVTRTRRTAKVKHRTGTRGVADTTDERYRTGRRNERRYHRASTKVVW